MVRTGIVRLRRVSGWSLACAALVVMLGQIAESADKRPAGQVVAVKSPESATKPPVPVRRSAQATSADEIAAEVDRLIEAELAAVNLPIAPRCNETDFLRRATLDLSGHLPEPEHLALFVLNPRPDKRQAVIDELVAGEQAAEHWARYWRDAIFSRATELRGPRAIPTFEAWMTGEYRDRRPWDETVRDLLTATGDITENGATALLFAQGAQPAEVAAEVARLFCGIQIQCANCHDHPSDIWKRQQFHELAAYFPRIQVRRQPGDGVRSFEVVSVQPEERNRLDRFRENPEIAIKRFDKNKDQQLSVAEVEAAGKKPFIQLFRRLLEIGDTDKNGMLNLAELKAMPMPDMPGRGSVEYFMPDLSDPSSQGALIEPRFFVTGHELKQGTADDDRRGALARELASPRNPWFAKAFVNRIWSELLGEGFYMPVDDLGPSRTPRFPGAMDYLANAFEEHHYDVQWLLRTIARTAAYQRELRPQPSAGVELPFAAAMPARLRADQIFNSIAQVLGFTEQAPAKRNGQPGGARQQFHQLFGNDPSTPQDELLGNVPQALFLMNSPVMERAIDGRGNTRLGRLLQKYRTDDAAIKELYLLVLTREPATEEMTVCQEHIRAAANRPDAYEDILWSLLNSSEFLSRR